MIPGPRHIVMYENGNAHKTQVGTAKVAPPSFGMTSNFDQPYSTRRKASNGCFRAELLHQEIDKHAYPCRHRCPPDEKRVNYLAVLRIELLQQRQQPTAGKIVAHREEAVARDADADPGKLRQRLAAVRSDRPRDTQRVIALTVAKRPSGFDATKIES